MMGITTHIRTAVTNDIPYLIKLAELEYNHFDQTTPFDPFLCERYIWTILNNPETVSIVLVDNRDIPFGYLTGMLDYIDLSTEPTAVARQFFVNNPKQMYGNRNYGLELIASFEGWAVHKGAKRTMIGFRMNPGQRRNYDRTFKSIDYQPNVVYYSKDMKETK